MTNSEPVSSDGMTVGRVALRVNDLDRTSEFYETVVGLELQRKTGDHAILGAGGEQLLELAEDVDAPKRKQNETGLFHTAFLVPSRSALGDTLVRIESEWELSGASDHRVSEALYLSDPEGNGVEVYCDRQREAWPTDDNGRVRMETLPLDTDDLRRERSGAKTVPAGTVVGHVHLEVSSIPSAREFYADTVGLTVRQEYGPSALFLAAADYHHHIGLNVWNHRTEPAKGCGLEWFELLVPNRDVLGAIRERLAARDITTNRIDRGFEVSDPDGISIHLLTDE
ncbi:VOC family protein [Haladaptatus caseinilyticus]|uniref:VOC family protein n=1 Tax=Haladaptatus caseinilyticus TaxID=2993314 RepID=UPI00224B9A58|nr:VOC family protein [Haladaptatus caseinilyticus]